MESRHLMACQLFYAINSQSCLSPSNRRSFYEVQASYLMAFQCPYLIALQCSPFCRLRRWRGQMKPFFRATESDEPHANGQTIGSNQHITTTFVQLLCLEGNVKKLHILHDSVLILQQFVDLRSHYMYFISHGTCSWLCSARFNSSPHSAAYKL